VTPIPDWAWILILWILCPAAGMMLAAALAWSLR
jgi:hypothetical protein